jgi:opacity protein-like surface antigen
VSDGWTVGGGGKFSVGPMVRIGGEYLYYSLGNQSSTVNPVPALPPFQVNYVFTNTYHVIRAVINLKF